MKFTTYTHLKIVMQQTRMHVNTSKLSDLSMKGTFDTWNGGATSIGFRDIDRWTLMAHIPLYLYIFYQGRHLR